MSKARSQARYINARTIQVGDVIRVTWQYVDTQLSQVGTVAKIRDTYNQREISTDRGVILLRWYLNLACPRKVTLLNRTQQNQQLEFTLNPEENNHEHTNPLPVSGR